MKYVHVTRAECCKYIISISNCPFYDLSQFLPPFFWNTEATGELCPKLLQSPRPSPRLEWMLQQLGSGSRSRAVMGAQG